MKSPQEFQKIFIHKDPVDMRKAINGLSEIVQLAEMGNLMAPHLFVFTGRRRNTIKILYFDKSGFAMWMKRLEKDKFPWPKKLTESVVTITPEQRPRPAAGGNLIDKKGEVSKMGVTKQPSLNGGQPQCQLNENVPRSASKNPLQLKLAS